MMVARQFIAWYALQRQIRPVGHGLICGARVCHVPKQKDAPNQPITPCLTGTVPFSNVFQAVNCLATITQTLRDIRGRVMRFGQRPVTTTPKTPLLHHSPSKDSTTRTTKRTSTKPLMNEIRHL